MTGLPEGFTLQYAVRLPDGELYASPNDHPYLWSTREGAELMLEVLSQRAHAMGARDWHGRIEYQVCSPFLVPDDQAAGRLADEIQAWLQQQTGGTP